MRLSRLELRNFRCFESLDLDLEQTTVVVGANDTGKSTVLEAIAWLLGRERPLGWQSAMSWAPGSDDDAPDVSIVGHLTDLSREALEAFGAVAPGGVLRLAKSSGTGDSDSWVVLERAELPSLTEAWDRDAARDKGGEVQSRFLGALVFEDQGGGLSTDSDEYLIIDGQQRLITLCILLAAIADADLEVPGDVSIIGISNMEWFPIARPAITAVSQLGGAGSPCCREAHAAPPSQAPTSGRALPTRHRAQGQTQRRAMSVYPGDAIARPGIMSRRGGAGEG